MRKRDRAVDIHAAALSNPPHSAGEIAQAIGGQKGGGLEWRNKKTAGQVSLVMLDAMKFSFYFLWVGVEGRSERLGNAGKRGENFGTLTREGRHAQGIN